VEGVVAKVFTSKSGNTFPNIGAVPSRARQLGPYVDGYRNLAVALSHPSATEAYCVRDQQGAKKSDRPLVA
jgi:hypothetical protein